MRHSMICALLMSALLGLSSAHAHASEITVSAAASLSQAFTDIAAAFTRKSGVQVHLNFASSNNLLRQMENGAPVDVFASADLETMDAAEEKGLISPDTRRNFALNDLVLITPVAFNGIGTVEDLKKESVRHIAVGTPESVPAGRYTRDALNAAGMWNVLSPRFIFGNNVRQVLSYVQRGETEAGFVYRTDALVAGKDVTIIQVMTGHKPVLYPIAVTKSSQNGSAAGDFVDYVLSKEGRQVLERYGFSKPE